MRDLLNDLSEGLSHPDPIIRAQIQMKKPMPKRFYKSVSHEAEEGGHAILLDGRPVKTPARKVLLVPTPALADMLVREWDAQAEIIDPHRMPVTRLINTALDGIADDPLAVADDIVKYAGNDMLCYRAHEPEGLVERQHQRWDPVLDWVAERFGARFILAEGVIHQQQPEEAVAAIRQAFQPHLDPIALAALHTMTTLSGSALLALAYAEGHLDLDSIWALAHLEEDWTIEHWGEDDEGMARRALRLVEMTAAADTFAALKN
nr:ATP12 family chaperone protein [uncultured Gellertiella sp.]